MGVSLPTGVSFPDGTSLAFTYETTRLHSPNVTGQLNQITLRELGTVAFTYSGGTNGIDCTYQTAPAVTRKLGNGDTTTYTLTHNLISGTNYNALNKMIDPGGNETDYTFTGLSATGNKALPVAQVITQIKRYQCNCLDSCTLLTTDTYSYNAAFSSSPSISTIVGTTNSFPITEIVVYHQINGMSTISATDTKFDAYGDITYSAQYDFVGTTPARSTTTYCTGLGGSNYALVSDKPCEIQTSQGGSVVSDAKYTYDQYGNLTKTSLWSGSAWIGQEFCK